MIGAVELGGVLLVEDDSVEQGEVGIGEIGIDKTVCEMVLGPDGKVDIV